VGKIQIGHIPTVSQSRVKQALVKLEEYLVKRLVEEVFLSQSRVKQALVKQDGNLDEPKTHVMLGRNPALSRPW